MLFEQSRNSFRSLRCATISEKFYAWRDTHLQLKHARAHVTASENISDSQYYSHTSTTRSHASLEMPRSFQKATFYTHIWVNSNNIFACSFSYNDVELILINKFSVSYAMRTPGWNERVIANFTIDALRSITVIGGRKNRTFSVNLRFFQSYEAKHHQVSSKSFRLWLNNMKVLYNFSVPN